MKEIIISIVGLVALIVAVSLLVWKIERYVFRKDSGIGDLETRMSRIEVAHNALVEKHNLLVQVVTTHIVATMVTNQFSQNMATNQLQKTEK